MNFFVNLTEDLRSLYALYVTCSISFQLVLLNYRDERMRVSACEHGSYVLVFLSHDSYSFIGFYPATPG